MTSADPVRLSAEPVAVARPPAPVELWPRGGFALALSLFVVQTVLLAILGWCAYSFTDQGRLFTPVTFVGACVLMWAPWSPPTIAVIRWARKRPSLTMDREGVHLLGWCCTRVTWHEIGEIRVHRPWWARPTAEVVVALTPEFIGRQGLRHRFGLSLWRACGARRHVIPLGGLAKPADEVAELVTRQRDAWLSHAFA